jgi:hypothetical protein
MRPAGRRTRDLHSDVRLRGQDARSRCGLRGVFHNRVARAGTARHRIPSGALQPTWGGAAGSTWAN